MRLPPAAKTGLLAFTIAFSGAAAPGPMLALVVGQSISGGVVATLFILAGHAVLEAGVIVLLAKGLSRRLSLPGVRAFLGIAGGGVLVWMGVELLAGLGGASLATASSASLSWYSLLVAGVAVSVSNPYFTTWWATVGTGQMATLGLRRPRDYVAFWVGHEMGDVGWYLPLSAAIALGCRWLTDGLYRLLLGACGGIIVLIGLLFVVLGFRVLGRK
jgi:threonine/homoserine/homoserine lactone efflux protein